MTQQQNELPELQILASDLEFPEGPVALRDGSVVVAEIAGQKLKRIHPDGTVTVVAVLGEIGRAHV